MPTYHFQHKDTGEYISEFLSISQLDTFLRDHPELMQVVTAPAVIGTMGKNDPNYKPKDKK